MDRRPKLNWELLAVVDEVVCAYRVLTAVAIDDAIPAKANPTGLNTAPHLLKDADATAREPGLWQQPEKKASRFCDVIVGDRNA